LIKIIWNKYFKIIIIKIIIFYISLMDENNSEENIDDYEILEEDITSYDLSFKLIVIGDAGK